MKNNKYYGIVNGVGYVVSRAINKKYYAFLLRSGGDAIRDWKTSANSGADGTSTFMKLDELYNRIISNEDEFARICKLNTLLVLKKEFGDTTWGEIKFFRFGEFNNFKEASEFIRERVGLILDPKNDVALAGPIFKNKDKTDEFLNKVKDNLVSRHERLAENIVRVNNVKSELNDYYKPLSQLKKDGFDVDFDEAGRALITFREHYIALLRSCDLRYIGRNMIVFKSKNVEPDTWTFTEDDASAVIVNITFNSYPGFNEGYIELRRTK